MATLVIPIEHIPYRAAMETYPEVDLARFGGFPPPQPEPPDPLDLLEAAIRADNPSARIERLPYRPGVDEEMDAIERRANARNEGAVFPPHLVIARNTEVLLIDAPRIIVTAPALRDHAPGLQWTPTNFTQWRQGYLTHYSPDKIVIDSTPSDPNDPDLAHYQLWIYGSDKMLSDKLSRGRWLKNGPGVIWGPRFDYADVATANAVTEIDREAAEIPRTPDYSRRWRPGQAPVPEPTYDVTHIEDTPRRRRSGPARPRRAIGIND